MVRIELRRPDKLNAMTAGMVEELHEALAGAGAEPECRVVVLTGAGRGFCAGLDLGGYGDPAVSAGSPCRSSRSGSPAATSARPGWLALEMPSFDAAVEFENRQQVLTMLTDDQTEAMRAYRDRTPPTYHGR